MGEHVCPAAKHTRDAGDSTHRARVRIAMILILIWLGTCSSTTQGSGRT